MMIKYLADSQTLSWFKSYSTITNDTKLRHIFDTTKFILKYFLLG